MSILWILLFVYLGLTWAFSIWALIYCVPRGEAYDEMAANMGRSQMWLKCVTFALVPFLGPLLPFIGIGCLIKQLRYRSELIKMSRLYFPPQYRRLRCDEMPVNVQQSIKLYEGKLESSGYSVDGYFHVKDKPFLTHSSLLMSQDGTIRASVGTLDNDVCIELLTVLSDESVVVTCAMHCEFSEEKLERMNQSDRLSLETLLINAPEFSLKDLLDRHRKHVDQMGTAVNPPLCFSTNRAVDLSVFFSRLFNTVVFEMGELDEQPPQADCPSSSESNPKPIVLATDLETGSIGYPMSTNHS